jgi:hypothetical protein
MCFDCLRGHCSVYCMHTCVLQLTVTLRACRAWPVQASTDILLTIRGCALACSIGLLGKPQAVAYRELGNENGHCLSRE